MWGLVVEVDELRPVYERLVSGGSAEKHGKGIRLSPAVLAELNTRADESEQAEARAMKQWETEVRGMGAIRRRPGRAANRSPAMGPGDHRPPRR